LIRGWVITEPDIQIDILEPMKYYLSDLSVGLSVISYISDLG